MTTEAPNAGETSTDDILGMSDEDFLKMNSPAAPKLEAAVETEDNGDKGQEDTPGSAVVEEPEGKAGEVAAADDAAEPDGDSAPGSADKPVADMAKADAVEPAKADPKGEVDADKAELKAEEKPVDYEGFFKQMMAPFKANGRTIELKTPEEAIRLMQMGAGYGRKIQDLQPHLKVLRMLEKNDLLAEDKLSFLIDVNQKNPDAIKKIIKDSGLDPLDLNIEDNVPYTPKNHAVSDREMAFQTALTDVQGHATGQETLRTINQTWDQESKSVLWDSPELLGVIQTQRDTGIYDQIVAEIDRQKLLGKIPHTTPFLQAYKAAGDHLQATNGFRFPEGGQAPQIQNQPGGTPQPQVIATRTAAPKAQVQNGDKASAAAQTKTVLNAKANITVNPLEMADDEFLKQFKGRL
jgi:hypothetical protein